jgi:hypothetical protein
MKPRSAPDLEPTGTEVAVIELPSGESQGQSSSTQSEDGTQSLVLGEVKSPDEKSPTRFTKARGKARAIEEPSELSRPTEVAGDRTTFADNNSMRSRLRPRNNTGHVIHIFSSAPTASHACAQPSQSSSTSGNRLIVANTHHHTRRRPKAKGKQKVMEPVILERHEWRCPVTLCERLHLSLHIESRGWVMDETQGAIPIFA